MHGIQDWGRGIVAALVWTNCCPGTGDNLRSPSPPDRLYAAVLAVWLRPTRAYALWTASTIPIPISLFSNIHFHRS